ncbi:hypothetical protein Mal64_04410 [Pseudobythopirellula maris]|uniref:Serine/threonine phosphatase stp n=1 Tax=Pseudobythopirellula maris TaxID=2527991 RepID=A0A5C5ZSL9_9BACT|nr:protein phosphatase 2C domain-containing protein [Pseudobythopirellula maris]TWT90058.1 hypothetical protein Mal64_04410 [Pseudobythopirellula maris]
MKQLDIAASGVCRDPGESVAHHLVASLSRSARVRQSSLHMANDSRLFGPPQAQLLIVSEGAGDEPTRMAAATAVDAVGRALLRDDEWLLSLRSENHEEVAVQLADAVKQAAHGLPGTQSDDDNTALNPHVSLTAALLAWPWVVVAHVGDSAAVVLRHGSPLQLTASHTAAAELVASGRVAEAPDADSPLGRWVANRLDDPDQMAIETVVDELQEGDLFCLGVSGVLATLHDESFVREACKAPHHARRIADDTIDHAKQTDDRPSLAVVVAKLGDHDDESLYAEADALEKDQEQTNSATPSAPPALEPALAEEETRLTPETPTKALDHQR